MANYWHHRMDVYNCILHMVRRWQAVTEVAFIVWGFLCFVMGIAITNLAIIQQDAAENEDEDDFDFWIDK